MRLSIAVMASIAAIAISCGFVGELGYESSFKPQLENNLVIVGIDNLVKGITINLVIRWYIYS